MVGDLFTEIANGIMITISHLGHGGIILSMAIESACIPLPSEIIMPFSGYLVSQGRFTLGAVTLSGALGNLIGSLAAYYAGARWGRPCIERYGKFFLISPRDLDLADQWFVKYGEATVFFSRLLPVIRTFISFPAGVAKMNIVRFCFYTFLGAVPWSFALAYVGLALGENWHQIHPYLHNLDLLIGVFLLGIATLFVYRHWPRPAGGRTMPPGKHDDHSL